MSEPSPRGLPIGRAQAQQGPAALLLSLLRGERAPGEGDARWPEALALAARHGVGPLLHQTASALPGAALAALRRQRIAALLEARRWDGALSRVFLALRKAQVPAAVLKGAASARLVYPSPELRPHADLDLLVLPGRFAEARAGLRAAGYTRHPATVGTLEDEPGWHEETLRDPAEPLLVIDLHQGFSQQGRMRLSPEALLGRAQAAPALAQGALALDPEDALLSCVASLGTHELRAPLIVLCDLARLLQRCDDEALLARVRAARLRHALFAGLHLLSLCAGCTGPEAEEAGRLGGAPVERARIASLLLALAPGALAKAGLQLACARYDLARTSLPRPEQLLRKALFIDRPVDSARFLAAHARTRLRRAVAAAAARR